MIGFLIFSGPSEEVSLKIELKLTKRIIENESFIDCEVTFINYGNDTIEMPINPEWGYKNDPVANLYFDIKRLGENDEYIDYQGDDNEIYTITEGDYLLFPNKSFTNRYPLRSLYSFQKGHYKVRAVFRINEIEYKSEWKQFDIQSNSVYHIQKQ